MPNIFNCFCVNALKNQADKAELEKEYKKELKTLDLKYQKLFKPIFQERSEIVVGSKEVDGNSSFGESEERDKGIPDFWLIALSNHSILEQMITEKDVEALKYLKDIVAVDDEVSNVSTVTQIIVFQF